MAINNSRVSGAVLAEKELPTTGEKNMRILFILTMTWSLSLSCGKKSKNSSSEPGGLNGSQNTSKDTNINGEEKQLEKQGETTKEAETTREAEPTKESEANTGKIKSKGEPDWCFHVPESLKTQVCKTPSGDSYGNFCQYIPEPSKKYVPACANQKSDLQYKLSL